MSSLEQSFARSWLDALNAYFDESLLRHLPEGLANLEDGMCTAEGCLGSVSHLTPMLAQDAPLLWTAVLRWMPTCL